MLNQFCPWYDYKSQVILIPRGLYMKIVAGIDTGTQSSKVVCYDMDQHEVLFTTSSPHRLTSRDDGSREQDASWWIEAIVSCFGRIPPEIRKNIVAMGVSGQQHGFVPVSGDGGVLYPVKLWCDTSTANECDLLMERAGGCRKVLEETGNYVMPGYTASKILWFKEHHPRLYARLAHILLPHDYINWWLTDAYTMEYGDASGTGLLDVSSRTWYAPLLSAIDGSRNVQELFPRLVNAGKPAGTVCSRAAKALGIAEGILVSCGGGDNMMGAIGSGTVSHGCLTMSLGTSGTLFGASDTPVLDPKGRLAAFCSSTGSWLPLLCTMNCTVASERTRNLFDLSVKEFDRLAATAPVGCEGVAMLPYFNGERTPNYPRGEGTLIGLSPTNMTVANISRAAMESAIFGMKLGLDAFLELGFSPRVLRVTGGGANSAFWRQMAADVCGLPVDVPKIGEAAAFGAALQALWTLDDSCGSSRSIEDIVQEHVEMDAGCSCKPDDTATRMYEKAYLRWKNYVDAMAPLFG